MIRARREARAVDLSERSRVQFVGDRNEHRRARHYRNCAGLRSPFGSWSSPRIERAHATAVELNFHGH